MKMMLIMMNSHLLSCQRGPRWWYLEPRSGAHVPGWPRCMRHFGLTGNKNTWEFGYIVDLLTVILVVIVSAIIIIIIIGAHHVLRYLAGHMPAPSPGKRRRRRRKRNCPPGNFATAPHLDIGGVDIDGFGGFDSFDLENNSLVDFLGSLVLDILGDNRLGTHLALEGCVLLSVLITFLNHVTIRKPCYHGHQLIMFSSHGIQVTLFKKL